MDYLKKQSMQQDIYKYCQAEGVDFEHLTYSIKKDQRKKRLSRIRSLLISLLSFKSQKFYMPNEIKIQNEE